MTSAFRYHHHLPERPITSPLYRQLVDEWIHLGQLGSTRLALARWSQAEPVLGSCGSPGELVEAVDRAGSPERQDAMLSALIRLTQTGHQLAGRVLLQLMLPKLGRMALRTTGASSDSAWAEDRRHIIVAEFWDVVANYPAVRRPRKVAANLALETLRRITEPRSPRADLPVDPVTMARTADTSDAAPLPGELTVDADLVEVIRWAVRRQIISRDDGLLLHRVYLPESGRSGTERAAAELGCSQAAIRQRCSRARRHLVAAVRAELNPVSAVDRSAA